jgi:8-oxo-dGTP diphosphatase
VGKRHIGADGAGGSAVRSAVRALTQPAARTAHEDRATVLVIREREILLVAKLRSRWALPGGKIERGESPVDAAGRELNEETGLTASHLTYLFQFRGLSTVHRVFAAEISETSEPEPKNEIARCRWFPASKIATLGVSVPTREIIELSLSVISERPRETTSEACI